MGTLQKYLRKFMIMSFWILEWEMFRTKVAEKIEKHVLCSVMLFFLENHAVYEILWKNVVETDRSQVTI